MKSYIVMPQGLATGLEQQQMANTDRFLNWGVALREQEAVIQRRAIFVHDFTPLELTSPPISTNPNVEVLSEWPSDWRYELPVS